jgi:hypothetical protein
MKEEEGRGQSDEGILFCVNYLMMMNLGESDASSDRFTSFRINFLGIF